MFYNLQEPKPTYRSKPVSVQHVLVRRDDVRHRGAPHPHHQLLGPVVPGGDTLQDTANLPGKPILPDSAPAPTPAKLG